MNTIITAATLLNMYFNCQVTGTPQHYYNPEIENGRVNSVEVYNANGVMLDRNLKCFFVYDGQNRLVSKQAMKWNETTGEYEPYYMKTYNYGDKGYTIEFCMWNARTRSYDLAAERMEYTALGDGITAVAHYKQNDAKDDWTLVSRYVEMNADGQNILTMD